MTPVESLLSRVDRELWLVTAQEGVRRGGLMATFVNSASIVAEAPRMLVGVARSHYTWELLEASGAFALHLLGESNIDWVWRFGLSSGRSEDKFAGMAASVGPTGSPILSGVVGWLECRVESRWDIGDRTLYLAEVVAGGPQSDEAPLTLRRLLERATPEQRAEMKRLRQEDAVLDAAAIQTWRDRRVGG